MIKARLNKYINKMFNPGDPVQTAYLMIWFAVFNDTVLDQIFRAFRITGAIMNTKAAYQFY